MRLKRQNGQNECDYCQFGSGGSCFVADAVAQNYEKPYFTKAFCGNVVFNIATGACSGGDDNAHKRFYFTAKKLRLLKKAVLSTEKQALKTLSTTQ